MTNHAINSRQIGIPRGQTQLMEACFLIGYRSVSHNKSQRDATPLSLVFKPTQGLTRQQKTWQDNLENDHIIRPLPGISQVISSVNPPIRPKSMDDFFLHQSYKTRAQVLKQIKPADYFAASQPWENGLHGRCQIDLNYTFLVLFQMGVFKINSCTPRWG